MELNEIINKAIPAESCPQKNANAMHRRIILEKRLKDYIAEQLANQFNAKPIEDKINNGMGEGPERRKPVSKMWDGDL